MRPKKIQRLDIAFEKIFHQLRLAPDVATHAGDGAAGVLDARLFGALHEVAGDVHAAAADGDVPVDDELARLRRRRGEALEVDHRLEAAHEDRFDVEREDVVQLRALGHEAHAREAREEAVRLERDAGLERRERGR